MAKGINIFSGVLSVLLIAGVCYGATSLYSNLNALPEGDSAIGTSSTPNSSTDSIVASFRNVQVINSHDLHFGDLVEVTSDNYLDYYDNGEELCNVYESRVESYAVSSIDTELSTSVVTELNSMLTEYYQSTGNSYAMIKSGYISQDDLVDYSQCDHVTGLSFDLSSYDGTTTTDYNGTGDFSWVADRANKYGFIQRYPSNKVDITGIDEPSHFRYVGLPHSQYMTENSLCLEEYLDLVRQYTYDNPLEYTTFNGRTYNVYYVKVDENNKTTNIPVLMDMEYSISGDNVGGYIVTVKVSG